jgi:hypothetical protein
LVVATTKTSIGTASVSEIAAALRERVLNLSPVDLQITESQPPVWGVLIETAHPDTVASLVALIDGSVSLYVSDGNGCVGCGAQHEVRAAGTELLRLATQILPQTEASSVTTLPPAGLVRFYILTRDGLRSTQTRLEDINLSEPLSALFFSGQRVLAAIERTGAGQSLAQEIRLALNAIQQQSPHNETNHVRERTYADHYGDEQCLSVGNVVRLLRT